MERHHRNTTEKISLIKHIKKHENVLYTGVGT